MNHVSFRLLLCLAVFGGTCAPAHAVDVPEPGPNDPRVRIVDYKKDEVTFVTVSRGVATRIILGDDEHILKAGTGFPAECKADNLEWCINADQGSNQIWVKPLDGATHNNLELQTDKRDYSFEFRVLNDEPTGRSLKAKPQSLNNEPMYRVVFHYPAKLPPLSSVLAGDVSLTQPSRTGAAGIGGVSAGRSMPNGTIDSPRPVPRNWKYSMKIEEGSAEIAPSLVFDDGRFTYFRFPGNRQIPTIYRVTQTGEEQHVPFNIDEHDRDLVVVQELASKFVLRIGKQTVGIWNDAYDAMGVQTNTGTTVDGLTREFR